MSQRRIRRPSPAFVMATIALFVGLGGTASAVSTTIVPLAKRALVADKAKSALVADNAKKLGGQTASALVSQAAQTPGPASSAAGIFSIKTGTWSLAPGAESDFTTTCDSGQKAVGGGWDDPNGWAHGWDDRPSLDGSSWRMYLTVSPGAPGGQSGTLYAVCAK